MYHKFHYETTTPVLGHCPVGHEVLRTIHVSNEPGMVGAPKVGPARPKIVSAQPSPLA